MKRGNLSLHDDIRRAINKHSAENVRGTSDYILAVFLEDCLNAFDEVERLRAEVEAIWEAIDDMDLRDAIERARLRLRAEGHHD
jgi:Mg2+ and Co2+ transporter CorA